MNAALSSYAPLTLTLSPSGARGSEELPLPLEGEGRGEGGASGRAGSGLASDEARASHGRLIRQWSPRVAHAAGDRAVERPVVGRRDRPHPARAAALQLPTPGSGSTSPSAWAPC